MGLAEEYEGATRPMLVHHGNAFFANTTGSTVGTVG